MCVGVYVFVRPKYNMCTYYRAPKARQQRSSDCTRLAAKPLVLNINLSNNAEYESNVEISKQILPNGRSSELTGKARQEFPQKIACF